MDRIRQNDGELLAYLSWLREQERSEVTIEKYLRDVRHFLRFWGRSNVECGR